MTRGKWQGMMTIARLNWPFYAAAAVVFIGALGLLAVGSRLDVRLACAIAAVGSGYFLFVSLGVSHLVYDRSDLYRWGWLERALRGAGKGQFVFCHSGFDEASLSLHAHLGQVGWSLLDHFDESRMSEPSIRRARRLFPPVAGTFPAPFDHWPVASHSVDVIFGLLAIHELRCERERIAWFAEARRCLGEGGRVVLVEHTRDLANFLAFGPGFVHFHTPASWRRCWARAGLRAFDEFRLTPWVRVFVIGAP